MNLCVPLFTWPQLDATGFILWRTFPSLRRLTIAIKQSGLPRSEHVLPVVRTRQAKMAPSLRFGEEWESHTFVSAGGCPPPSWVYSVRRLVQQATFRFMGSDMPVVDQAWARERFQRQDAITYGLMRTEAPDKRPQVPQPNVSLMAWLEVTESLMLLMHKAVAHMACM